MRRGVVAPAVNRHPEQPGDVPQTWANVDKARALLVFNPSTPYDEGVVRFVAWLRAASASLPWTP